MRARFSASVQTRPGAHTAYYTMGTGSFPGVKRPGRGVEHPPPYSAEVEGRVELYIYPPFGSSWPVIGWNLPFTFTFVDLNGHTEDIYDFAPKAVCAALCGIFIYTFSSITTNKCTIRVFTQAYYIKTRKLSTYFDPCWWSRDPNM